MDDSVMPAMPNHPEERCPQRRAKRLEAQRRRGDLLQSSS
jgi:membrane carboxypeptidase/penicillin-binding protein PbpC